MFQKRNKSEVKLTEQWQPRLIKLLHQVLLQVNCNSSQRSLVFLRFFIAEAPKGKVGADAYGTMQIANKNALSPSFIAKKGEPKKFAAGGAYGTMMGIGDKMVASKQK